MKLKKSFSKCLFARKIKNLEIIETPRFYGSAKKLSTVDQLGRNH